MISWSRYPDLSARLNERPRSELRSHDGRFRIQRIHTHRPIYRLWKDGVEDSVHATQRDAKAAAEAMS